VLVRFDALFGFQQGHDSLFRANTSQPIRSAEAVI
jgi:hypothetical protein